LTSLRISEYEFLVLLREFDIRQGWKAYHFTHCAQWLNMKCGIHPGTGREKVRVARALWDLPRMSAAFGSGELSYSKARAMTRLATPENEQALLDYALSATAEQVDTHCRTLRNVQRDASTKDTNRIHKQRYLSRTLHGDGSMTISVELTQEDGELVMKALERAVSERENESSDASRDARTSGTSAASVDSPSDSCAEPRSATFFAKQADALVDMARAYHTWRVALTGAHPQRITTRCWCTWMRRHWLRRIAQVRKRQSPTCRLNRCAGFVVMHHWLR
jgi:hypothetical protein